MNFIVKQKKWLIIFIAAVLLITVFVLKNNNDYQTRSVSESFRFAVMGDSRGASSAVSEAKLRTLLQSVKELSIQPSFIMFSGDMISGESNIARELKSWKRIVDDYYPIEKYYPTLGNHEDDEAAFSNSFRYLPIEQLKGYKRTAYYFDYGNARFIVLNSNRKDDYHRYIIDSKQRAWLAALLKNNGKTHNFVMFHVPAYPIGPHYGESLDENPAERDALWAILDKYNVTAVFVSHEHNYNRRIIDNSFSDNGYTFNNQINQITLGGAGAPLSAHVLDSRNVVAGPYRVYHYMIVDVVDEVAAFKVYDINNELIDYFTVDKKTNLF